jgi:anthranilate synthase/aminodeoxychorismate synthase-like glutamine amidotransferase
MPGVLLIDNYDSFTHNLAQAVLGLGAAVSVFRNDEIGIDAARAMRPTHLIISPGPGRPESAGVSVDLIRALAGRVPVLGVCLGHQAIGHLYGGMIVGAGRLMHGKTSRIQHDGTGLYAGLPAPFEAGRYHSLLIEERSLPDVLAVTARSEDGEIMGVRHRALDVEGVQFHPESILTPAGERLIANFLHRAPGAGP